MTDFEDAINEAVNGPMGTELLKAAIAEAIEEVFATELRKAESDFESMVASIREASVGLSHTEKISFLVAGLSEAGPETNCVLLAIAVSRLIEARDEVDLIKITGTGL